MENFNVQGTISCGSTAKVKRVVTLESEERAVKIMKKERVRKPDFLKEMFIHKNLEHPNILKYFDSYSDHQNYYLVMELGYCEITSLIGHGVGLHPLIAHLYFKQLLNALEYLHGQNICHRDVKPENILISKSGNLLLTDFGHSTYFYYKGAKRRCSSLAGSYEYMAPEVLMNTYNGELADIWSCGVTLIVFLTGKTPWSRPTRDDDRFVFFMKYHHKSHSPFNRIRDLIFDLIKKMLRREKERSSLKEVKEHCWVNRSNRLMDDKGLCSSPDRVLNLVSHEVNMSSLRFSQPGGVGNDFTAEFVSSQPLISIKNELPGIYRMYLVGDVVDVVCSVTNALDRMAVSNERKDGVVLYSTTDTQRNILSGKIYMKKIKEMCYITFEKTKGCSHEFKRFVNTLSEIISE